jgi:hypothetical protein
MDLFDTLTFTEILVGTTFLGTPTLTVLYCQTRCKIGLETLLGFSIIWMKNLMYFSTSNMLII